MENIVEAKEITKKLNKYNLERQEKEKEIYNQALEDLQKEDLQNYTIEVHALKNTARMIGAMQLSADFYRLEQLGNKEEADTLVKETPKVLELYRSYKPILKPYAASETEKKVVDKAVVIEVLLKIRDAMDCFDLDGADAALKELEEYQLPEHLQDNMELLRAYVADVAMEDVMRLTEEMAAELNGGINA